jgi:NAD(P)-dependent dehydrogenase (short-subunit alcohol dehydrogenase family)
MPVRQGTAALAPKFQETVMSKPVVLVTGALTGIGRATALAFARQGDIVVVSGRREAEGKALEAELRGLGAEAAFIAADEQTPESYAAMFETNVLGTLLSLKHELRVMQPQGSGSIVNISSTMGERGAANLALYTASKHAVEGLTKSAALEAAAFGVRVNAVAPGPTDTAMLDRLTGSPDKKASFYAAVPLKRGARPEEIAEAVSFLASERASFITGQIIRVNGGKTAS